MDKSAPANPVLIRRRVAPGRRPRAFTFLELLVAIIIGLILMTLAIAGFRLFGEESPSRVTATQLQQMMSNARAFAIARNSTYTVKFEVEYLLGATLQPLLGASPPDELDFGYLLAPTDQPINFGYLLLDSFWLDETDADGTTLGLAGSKIMAPQAILDNVRLLRVTIDGNMIDFIDTDDLEARGIGPDALRLSGLFAPTDFQPLFIRFFPDGSSDDVRITFGLRGPRVTDEAFSEHLYTVRLYGATGQSRILEGF